MNKLKQFLLPIFYFCLILFNSNCFTNQNLDQKIGFFDKDVVILLSTIAGIAAVYSSVPIKIISDQKQKAENKVAIDDININNCQFIPGLGLIIYNLKKDFFRNSLLLTGSSILYYATNNMKLRSSLKIQEQTSNDGDARTILNIKVDRDDLVGAIVGSAILLYGLKQFDLTKI